MSDLIQRRFFTRQGFAFDQSAGEVKNRFPARGEVIEKRSHKGESGGMRIVELNQSKAEE
jgi:hypothetical protein